MLLGYSMLVEPNWLEITKHSVKLKDGKNHIKIAFVSDIHSDKMGTVERKLQKALANASPDIIVFTGDLATPGGRENGYDQVLKMLSPIAPTYFVPGNWEKWEPISNLTELLKKNKIVDLNNKVEMIRPGLWLLGFDDDPTGNPSLDPFSQTPPNAQRIAIFHSPSFYNVVKDKVDLALAGHSHGGQVRFPFLGSLWLPKGSLEFDAGWFKSKNSKLYVTRGIGNSILPIRFNCRPELSIINITY